MNEQFTTMMRPRSLLVIAGSGRSGTSLMAGLAGRLGFRIPQPELHANHTNPRGFGEPRWAVDFHRRLMELCTIAHDDGRPNAWERATRAIELDGSRSELQAWLGEQFDLTDRVVVKDPRLGWFLGLYQAAADDLGVDLGLITMLRHPAETVRSKQLAYGTKIEGTTRGAGWLNMTLGTEHRSRKINRAIVRYDDLLRSWRPTVEQAEKILAFGLVASATDQQLHEADDLVDPSLLRTPRDWDELNLPTQLRELMQSTYQAMDELAVTAGGGPATTSTAQLDVLREAYATSYRDAEAFARSSIAAARKVERRRATKAARKRARDQPHSAEQEPESPSHEGTARDHSGPSSNVARRAL